MTYPERYPGTLAPLDLVKAQKLEFYEPDFKKFPCLTIARDAAAKGGLWPTVMNAANEIAVDAFLNGRIKFTQIPHVIEKTLSRYDGRSRMTLETVLAADIWARNIAKESV